MNDENERRAVRLAEDQFEAISRRAGQYAASLLWDELYRTLGKVTFRAGLFVLGTVVVGAVVWLIGHGALKISIFG